MIRLFALLFSLLLALPLRADLNDRFDAGRLTHEDTRLLQAALSFGGFYVGRIDGRWGARSGAALRRAAGPAPAEWQVLETLRPFLVDAEISGWRTVNPSGTSVLLPRNVLVQNEGPDWWEVRTPDRSLIVRYIWRTPSRTSDMHRWLEEAHVGPAPLYRADTASAFVTRGAIATAEVYLRTIATNGAYETVLVQWDPPQAGRARVIMASLSNGWVAPLGIPEHGYFSAMIAEPPAPDQATPRIADWGGDAGDVDGTGTGFYVNDTDIVTAAHVVEGCERLTLADNSAVLVLSTDAGADLAVLRAARRSERWLDLAVGADTTLGAPVLVLGYPYAGLFAQGISATRGNVSALRGLAGEDFILTITAPVQPGNSGGPLMDERGRVIGVITHRASEDYVRERSGTAPENMNGATRLQPLRALLAQAGVALPPPGAAMPGLDSGLPPALTDAVVLLRCHKG